MAFKKGGFELPIEQEQSEEVIKPEIIRETAYWNLSGQNMQEVLHWFPRELKAEKITLLPDLCPGKSPLPTGCCVEIKQEKQPDWRKFAISDVGCGMRVLRSDLKWDDFDKNRSSWDEVLKRLRSNKGKLGDLGGGNHFLDAVVDPINETIYFVVHTGSRDESPKAAELINKPKQFDKIYQQITEWAKNNRETVADVLEKIYGKLELVSDKPHNFYEQDDNKALIYKGSVKLRPGETTIIPSNMDGEMAIVEGKEHMEIINNAMCHGTGRIKSRSESKKEARDYDFKGLRERIYIPEAISNSSLSTENPKCYRDLDKGLELIEKFVRVRKKLTPVAYIGQL